MAGVCPGTPLHPTLDFTNCMTSIRDEKEPTALRALTLIVGKLGALKDLNALIEVTLGDSPTQIIDGRGSRRAAKMPLTCKDPPDARIKIKPDYILDFVEGKLEPRYALFKDSYFHPAYMPQGDIAAAIRFADLLTPKPPQPLLKYTPEAFPILPQPTEDIEKVKSDIEVFGYGFVKNALSPEQVVVLRKAVLEQAAGERMAGVEKRDGGPGTPNTRIWVLSNKGDEFLDLLNHPLIDAMVPWYLGEHAHIHSYFANIVRPGNQPMQVHNDQLCIQPPNRDIAYGLNIMWFLGDMTEERGATRIYPKSHKGNVAPENILSIDGSIAAEGPAGTAMVFESRLWHATGRYTAPSGERPAILMFFMRSFIRQQENNGLSLRKDVEKKLSDRHKRLLGFYTTGALGGVDGEVREGIFVSRSDVCVGRLREPVDEENDVRICQS